MLTVQQAQEVIEECFGDDQSFCRLNPNEGSFWKLGDHKKENTVAFTVNVLSLDVLFAIMEHDLVENVYFNAGAAPPRSHHMGVSDFRFKVYVEFNVEVQA